MAFPPMGKGFGKVLHVAYLVPDLDAGVAEWIRHAGVGPWTCIRNIELDASFRGQPLRLKIHEALSYIGDLQIQLVQSLNPLDVDTPYSDQLRAGRYGLHHTAFLARDIDAAVAQAEAQGFEAACRMQSADGHRYYYCRSRTLPDVWFEFIEEFPLVTQWVRDGIANAARWDGSNPITNIEYGSL